MADLIRKPGVEITQVISATPTPTVSPTLAPCVVGPAFEVMETTVDGAPNPASQISSLLYNQQASSVSPSSFRTNHADISEVSVSGLTDEISAALFRANGDVINLDPDAKSAYLDGLSPAHRPAVFFLAAELLDGAGLIGFTTTLRVSGTGLAQAQLIQVVAGETTAEFIAKFKAIGLDADLSSGDYSLYVALPDVSSSYGPNAFLNIKDEDENGILGFNDNQQAQVVYDIQVNGAGLYANPQPGRSTTTKIQASSGAFYFYDDLSAANLNIPSDITMFDAAPHANDPARPAWIPVRWDGELSSASVGALPLFPTFDALNLQGALPTRSGDLLIADGIELGQVLSILPGSIEVGTVDSANSQYNAEGGIINQVYTRVALTRDFSPKHAYFIANELSAQELDGTVNASVGIDISGSVDAASTASVTFTINVAADLSGLALLVQTSQSGSTTSNFTFVFPNGTDHVAADLAVEMNNQIAASGQAQLFTVSEAGGTITVETIATGADQGITLLSAADGSTALNASYLITGSGAAEVSGNGSNLTSSGALNAADAVFVWTLDDNEYEYSVNVGGLLVNDLIDAINLEAGYTLASVSTVGAATTLTLSSSLAGRSSAISVSAFAPLAIGAQSATGTGRPNPNISITSTGIVSIGAQIIRNQRTGSPLSPVAIGEIGVGIAYRGLRLDLSTAATNLGLLQISDVNDLTTQLSPVDTRNPLSLGIYYAMLNAGDGVTVSAIGVDDVSSSEPEGTALAYMRAAEFIEAHEVYAVAPLSHSEEVIGIFNQHVTDMSAPEAKRERVLISAPHVPTRRNSIVLSSGESAEYSNTPNLVDLNDGGIEASADSNGVDPSLPIPAVLDDRREVVLQIELGDDTRYYSVSAISGSMVTVRVSGMPNSDGYYSAVPIASSFSDAKYSLFIRGSKLLLPGTNIADRQAIATTVRDRAQQYNNRRQLRLFPDSVQSVIGGVEQSIPMYFFACAIAGETADLNAETPFSRRSMDGFTGVDDLGLTSDQLDITSAGNCVIEVEAAGMAPSIRIQSTTAPDAIETREYSIVKAVDFFSKQLRSSLKGRVGLFNITQTYIDDTSTIVDIICQGAVNNGLLASANITRAEQDANAPDTMRIDVNVGVLYPANYIKVTIFV